MTTKLHKTIILKQTIPSRERENISHLGKRKIIFKHAFLGGYVSSLEGICLLLDGKNIGVISMVLMYGMIRYEYNVIYLILKMDGFTPTFSQVESGEQTLLTSFCTSIIQ